MIFIFLCAILLMLLFFVFGLKSRRNKILQQKWVLGLIFGISSVAPLLFFDLPFFATSLVNVFAIAAFWIGLKFSVIGLTGGISCGKSAVSNILRSEGFKIIDADKISHDLRRHDRSYQQLLV